MKKIQSPFAEELLKYNPAPYRGTDKKERAAMRSSSSPLAWMILMFIFSVLYLIPEAVFNAVLTNVAGGKHTTDVDLRLAELLGRIISGIGVSLLIADVLIKGQLAKQTGKALLTLSVITLVTWPTVFFGQKWLVDYLVVNPSTPEQRQQAFFSQLLRRALIENSIVIEGIQYNPDQEQTAEEKTFLSIIGGLVYADNQLIDEIEARKTQVVEKFVRDQAMNSFDEHYQSYTNFREKIKKQYLSYRDSSKRYRQAIDSSQERANEYWLEMQNEIAKGWKKYQKAEMAFEARVDARAQEIAPRIYKYFQKRNKCYDYSTASSQQSCLKRADSAYKDQFNDLRGVPYIEPNQWLIKEKVSTMENGLTTLLSGVLTGGVSTAFQLVNKAAGGDGGFKDYRYKYTNDVNHYKQVLRPHLASDFQRESGGYPLGIESLHLFRFHEVTSHKTRQKLVAKGLYLPTGWTTSQRAAFNQSVRQKVIKETKRRWHEETAKSGIQIQPNRSWKQFQLNSSIQKQIASEMGDLYVNPMLADWNNEQFRQRVVEINVRRKAKGYLEILKAQQKEFADGRAYESLGKEALRATIVPPISMALSLFLVIMTVIKLPGKALELVRVGRNKTLQTDYSKSKLSLVSSSLIKLVPVVLVLLIPVMFWTNKYTEDKSAVNYFLNKVEKQGSMVTSNALHWLLSTQPVIQPFGESLDQSVGITSGFTTIRPVIDRLDQLVFPIEHTTLPEPAAPNTFPLTILSNRSDATIMVMNIKPSYKPGMLLPAGNYDIKVSAPGTQPVRRLVRLSKQQTEFIFNL